MKQVAKKWNKEHQILRFQFFTNKSSILMFFVLFFHVVCKISNFNAFDANFLYWVNFNYPNFQLSLLKGEIDSADSSLVYK